MEHPSSNTGRAVAGDPRDVQIDEETGRPVAIEPDGEKDNTEPEVPESERLRIDPDSRIPRPVQPDLA